MSGIWIQILQFLAALSLLIVLHEGGHFFFARLFKTRVEKFYLFFDFLFPFSGLLNFSLLKKKIGDTEYGIGWFPLGGYVKIAGMVDESMDTDKLSAAPEPWEFRSKKAWQRLFIMLGGIIVNVLLAFIIYSGMMMKWGEEKVPLTELHYGIDNADSFTYKLGFRNGDVPVAINGVTYKYYSDFMKEMLYANTVTVKRDGKIVDIKIPEDFLGQASDNQIKGLFTIPFPAIVDSVEPKSAAAESKLISGDRIMGVDSLQIPSFLRLKAYLKQHSNQNVILSINRKGQELYVPIKVSDTGTIGFIPQMPTDSILKNVMGYHYRQIHYGFFAGIKAGLARGGDQFYNYIRQFKKIFNPKTGAYKGMGGFISLTKIFPKVWDWESFWGITAFLSVALAVMNLLPIPGLDGGYVLFTLIEMVTGKKINEKVMEVVTTVGLILLLIIMVYFNGNDVYKLFKK